MGPELLALAGLGGEIGLGTALTAAGTAVGAVGSYAASKAQADADQAKANAEGAIMRERAKEERAVAQRVAGEETRKARLAQSRLGAVAAGSGAGASDDTVLKLWGDIEKEGQYNAAQATASGEQKATGLNYQADMDRWSADANARIRRAGATNTLIGGMLSAGGQLTTKMGARYGSYTGNENQYTYGGRSQGYR